MAQTQFRSDDTVAWWLKYGNGSDGAYSSAGNATDAPVDASCSGTSGTTSLSATNASFANGKPILIHQTRGTGVGNWELNQISSYSTGTITTVSPLKNTYTDSGASQAQVIQLKQYSSFTQNSGHTLTAKAWGGNVGGILAFLCNGTVTVTGTITGTGKGFRGGQSVTSGNGYAGEGSSAASLIQQSANLNGGGGGLEGGSGGGGGFGTAGAQGQSVNTQQGAGGSTDGNAGLTDMVFGGGGGSGAGFSVTQGTGGSGGGIILIVGKSITVSGAISCGGSAGTAGVNRGSGGGSGGGVLIKSQTATLGSNKITAPGNSGGVASSDSNYYGGAGGAGRIHLDYLTSYTGTTTPTINVTQDYSLRTSVSSGIII